MKRITTQVLFVAILIFVTVFQASTQETAQAFEFKAVMIPMRDGVKLNTHIFAPRGHSASLPIILERTPYRAPDSPNWAQGKFKELAADGYIFVFQDIRGRYKSEGQFVMQRAGFGVEKRPEIN